MEDMTPWLIRMLRPHGETCVRVVHALAGMRARPAEWPDLNAASAAMADTAQVVVAATTARKTGPSMLMDL